MLEDPSSFQPLITDLNAEIFYVSFLTFCFDGHGKKITGSCKLLLSFHEDDIITKTSLLLFW